VEIETESSATRFQKYILSVRLLLSASSSKEREFNKKKKKIPTASRFPGFLMFVYR
jgi:hypothetical protein